MGHDSVRAAGYGQFQKEFITGVGEDWLQTEVDVDFPACEAEGSHNGVKGAFWDLQALSLSFANGFVVRASPGKNVGKDADVAA